MLLQTADGKHHTVYSRGRPGYYLLLSRRRMRSSVASAQRAAPGGLDDAETRVTTAPRIADQVHAILRGQIISGELLPNQRLTERGLSATLGVSPTPVREAISQLEYERLLVRIDGRPYV